MNSYAFPVQLDAGEQSPVLTLLQITAIRIAAICIYFRQEEVSTPVIVRIHMSIF